MKITIKTDPETLFLLHKIILDECQMIANNTGRKSGKSMRIEIFEILARRCITYSANPNGKKLNITLKYHLANLVYEILSDLRLSLGIYEANKMEMLKNELHLKLL